MTQFYHHRQRHSHSRDKQNASGVPASFIKVETAKEKLVLLSADPILFEGSYGNGI
ncbi:hypothetical protein [Xenorhabdus anantnagensis]|uniref:Uncharacterized protein n=1 Tax=Xenorhabdus anantnagensis TaxID=3025875 RepID=A0ABT5LMM3_9GAMM|nr:hypothetical protein [Xenorhabdus anantnagensis]MDC9595650.1 hypothetical protein [Xenorhabdus anantnagensis]